MQVVQDKCIEKRGFGAWPTDENFFFWGPVWGYGRDQEGMVGAWRARNSTVGSVTCEVNGS